MTTNGDQQRQTANSGRSDAQTRITAPTTSQLAGASVICRACDGTGWTSHATKGLTRCKGLGFPHA